MLPRSRSGSEPFLHFDGVRADASYRFYDFLPARLQPARPIGEVLFIVDVYPALSQALTRPPFAASQAIPILHTCPDNPVFKRFTVLLKVAGWFDKS